MKKKTVALVVLALLTGLYDVIAQDDSPSERLFSAAQRGEIEEVKRLLAEGVDVNSRTRYGGTPLAFAVDKGNVELVEVLLAAGADVNAKDNRQLTSLDLARKRTDRRAAAVIELLEKATSAGN